MIKKKFVVLSGAGISKESNIATFRDSKDGLWNKHKISQVCTAEAWDKDPSLVNEFYNDRRKEIINTHPNKAHFDLVEAEKYFDVHIITQNVDDLHERAGSTNVLHIHGEIMKARSSNPIYDWAGISHDPKINNYKKYDVGIEGLSNKSVADDGYQLRPDVVFFGETVPNITTAYEIIKDADILLIVGTSLAVYPANTLVNGLKDNCKVFYVDLDDSAAKYMECTFIKKEATKGIRTVLDILTTNNM